MSHEVETMAWHTETPWHGLGVEVNPDTTAEEWLKASGLEWTVERRALFTVDGEIDSKTGLLLDGSVPKRINIPGRRALVRSSDSKVLGVASPDWKPVQNADILGFFREYAEAGGIRLETAGSLKGGQIVWALANLDHGYAVGKDDRVRGYLLFATSHKPGNSTMIRTTPIRVVCANTMAVALRRGLTNYRQNHLTEFDFSKAREMVELAHETLAETAARSKTLLGLKMSVQDTLVTLAPFFGAGELTPVELATETPAKLTEIMYSVNSAPGATPGNAWGVLNGVTHWIDHIHGRTANTRMFRSWIGDMAKTKSEVEAKLFEMANG